MNSRRHFITGLGALAASSILPARSSFNSKVFTATDVHVKDYPTVKAVQWFGQELANETDGRISIHQFHSGQLGRESEAIDMARYQAIDITRVYSGGLNNAFPMTRALCLPYVFNSVAHLRRVIDSAIGQNILSSFETRGLIGLAIYDSGARSFYNTRRAIYTPQDMQGLKLRVPLSDIFMQLIRDFSANPTPLAYGEVYSALQTHLIDGAENNIKSFHSSRQFESAHFWSETQHSYAPDILVMSKRSFDSLAFPDQERVRRLAKQSVNIMRSLWDATAEESLLVLKEQKVQFNSVDIAAFQKASLPLLTHYRRNSELDKLYRAIQDKA